MRMHDLDDLVSLQEIGNRTGRDARTVRGWRNDYFYTTFPAPKVNKSSHIKLYSWAEIQVFLRKELNSGDLRKLPTRRV